jgi:hypothetical protein
MLFVRDTGAAGVVRRHNVNAGGGIPRAELWRTPSKRDRLTLSQRSFSFSVHTSSLRREKTRASRWIGGLAMSRSGSTLRFANFGDHFPTSITPSVHLSGADEYLDRIGTDL